MNVKTPKLLIKISLLLVVGFFLFLSGVESADAAATVTQRSYMFLNDDGAGGGITNTTIQAATSTARTNVKRGERMLIGFHLDNTGDALSSIPLQLQYDLNDSSWNLVSSTTPIQYAGSFTSAMGGRGAYYQPISSNTPLVQSSCTSSGSYIGGRIISNIASSTPLDIGVDDCAEIVFAIQVATTSSLNQTYRLRLVNAISAAVLNTYTVYPTLTTETAQDIRYSKEARGGVSTSTPDNPGGAYTAMAIGTDGYPVIAYYDVINGDLDFMKCNDISCISVSTTTLDSTGDVGRFISLAIGTDGYPVISYRDMTNSNLKFVKCEDASCSSVTQRTFGTFAASGYDTSIAIGADGYPVISHFNGGPFSPEKGLHFVKCNDASCSSTTLRLLHNSGSAGQYTAIAIGTDGYPVISYYDNSGSGDLDFIKCNDASCSSITQRTLNSTEGPYTAIAIGTDGYPVISYLGITNLDAKFIKCNDDSCSSTTIRTLHSSANSVGYLNSITIGTDGYPVISYYNNTDFDLEFIKCNDASCSSITQRTLDSAGDIGAFPSIVIGTDGYPIISYRDAVGDRDLIFLKCNNISCAPDTDSEANLPTDSSDLVFFLDDAGYTAVGTSDNAYDSIDFAGSSVSYLFTTKNGDNTSDITYTWEGQVSESLTTQLEIYNFNTNAWEVLASSVSPTINTDFTLSDTQTTSVSDYYDGNNVAVGRITVATSTTNATLKSDHIEITFTVVNLINLSGTLFSDEGSTQITTGKTINLAVGTSTVGIYSTTTDSGAGTWTFENINTTDFAVGTPLAVWVSGDTNTRAFTLTKASSTATGANITGVDLYQNRVIAKHEGTSGTTTTITDFAIYDADDDSDIQFTANSGTLEINSDQELHIWTGDTFAPGGAITLHGNASSTTDGSLHIDDSATLAAGGAISVAGNWNADTGSTFTHNSNTVTFTASTTGKTIAGELIAADTFSNVTFNGSGGAWTFNNNASTTDLIITSGTVTAPTLLSISGNYTNNGSFTAGSGTIFFTGSSKTYSGTLTGTSAFNNLVFTGAGLKTISPNASSTNITIENSAQLVAPTLLSISGNYTNNGSFTDGGGTVLFDGTNQTITGTLNTATTDFATVIFANSGTKTISVNASTTGFTIDSGVTVVTPTLLTVAGNYTNNGDFTDGGGSNTVYFNGTVTLAGQMTGTADDFNIIEFVGAGTKTLNANASTTDFAITAGTVDISGQLITIAGNLSNSGILTTDATSKLYFTGTSKTLSGTLIGTSQLRDVEFLNSGSWSFSNNASTTDFTITNGAVTAPPLLSISGNYTNSGTFANNSGTTTFNGTAVQSLSGTLVGSSAFYNIEILNTSATTTFSSAASTTNNFYAVQPNSRIEFANAATSTLVNFTITGTSGNEIYLHSDSPSTQWNIHSTGTRAVTYANIKDSDACSAAGTIDVTDGTSIDGTNNDCWDFTTPLPTISSAANQVFEIGQATTSISVITVTDDATPTITSINDLRIAIATSSVDMLWDTTDTTAVFGGSAWTDDVTSSTVSYEGGGSVLVISVANDFEAGDILTIDGLSFTSFNSVNAAISALDIFKDGSTDFISDADDDKTVVVKGTLTLAEHDNGQESNKFGISNSTVTSAELYAFKLTPTSENINITNLVIGISVIVSINTSDITNAELYIDYNGNGTIDAGDDQVGGAGTPSVSGNSGTITFSTSFTATTTRNYILKADVTGILSGDQFRLTLPAGNITADGSTSAVTITSTGSVIFAQHIRPLSGGGPVSGGSVAGSGQQSGGSSEGGERIGDEPGFLAPTANASVGSYTEWTTPSNANSSDGLYATRVTTLGANDWYNFSFTVPSGNTINGIEVKLEASASTAAGTIDAELSWDGGTSTTTPVKSTGTLTTTDVVYTLGGVSDLWGSAHTWVPGDFSNANFRLRLIGQPSSNTIQIDAIQVKVFHQAGGGSSGGGGAVYKPIIHNLANTIDALGSVVEVLRALFLGR